MRININCRKKNLKTTHEQKILCRQPLTQTVLQNQLINYKLFQGSVCNEFSQLAFWYRANRPTHKNKNNKNSRPHTSWNFGTTRAENADGSRKNWLFEGKARPRRNQVFPERRAAPSFISRAILSTNSWYKQLVNLLKKSIENILNLENLFSQLQNLFRVAKFGYLSSGHTNTQNTVF